MDRKTQLNTTCSGIALELAHASAGAAPEWVQLFPAASGVMKTGDGRRFSMADAQAVIAASLEGGRPLAIDYDHATDLAAKKGGGPAPAAGWITELKIGHDGKDDGIWGRVEWTAKGEASVAGREYRFLSPTFTATKKGMRVIRLLRAALTNDPAFDTMRALASKTTETPETTETEEDSIAMDELLKALCAALGLDPEKTSEEAVVTAVAALAAAHTETAAKLKAVTTSLAVAEDAGQEIITAAITKRGTVEPDPTKFVPMAVVQDIQTELATLKSALIGDKATAAVDTAIKDGRLSPANRDWGIALASADLDSFQDFVGKQPQLVGGRVQLAAAEADALTPEEKIICKSLGVAEDKFLATKKAQAAKETV